jgi:hypothetical protein
METRTNWGMIVLGVLFAVIAISVAGVTFYFESSTTSPTPLSYVSEPTVAQLPDSDNDGIPDWQEKIFGSNPERADSNGNGISDAQELAFGTLVDTGTTSPTGSLTQDLLQKYTALRNGNTFTTEDLDAVAQKLVNTHVQIPNVADTVSLNELNIIATSSAETYTQLLLIILRQSTQIKEHELTTFRRTVEAKQYGGNAALTADAVLYKKIQDALIKIDVPSQVSIEHLSVVNSIGSLANIVTLMSVWSGDPLTGIVYVDTFNKAESDVSQSVATLLTRIGSLMKKV